MRDCFRHAKHGRRPGTIVIGAVANCVAADRLALSAAGNTDMIIVRADGHVLVFQFRIGAFPNSDYVLGHDMSGSHTDRDAHVLIRVKIERRDRIGGRRASRYGCEVKFLTVEQGSRHLR